MCCISLITVSGRNLKFCFRFLSVLLGLTIGKVNGGVNVQQTHYRGKCETIKNVGFIFFNFHTKLESSNRARDGSDSILRRRSRFLFAGFFTAWYIETANQNQTRSIRPNTSSFSTLPNNPAHPYKLGVCGRRFDWFLEQYNTFFTDLRLRGGLFLPD